MSEAIYFEVVEVRTNHIIQEMTSWVFQDVNKTNNFLIFMTSKN